MAKPKTTKSAKRQKDLARLRVRAQSRAGETTRGRDLGDVRLQLLLLGAPFTGG